MRTRRLVLIGTAALLGSAATGAALAQTAEEAVRRAFERYRAALLARDGAAAAGLVTAGSHAYYERLRDLALSAGPDALRAEPLAEQLAVLRLRHEFTAEELAPLSGRELIATSVAEAWNSPQALAALELGEVTAADGTATALVTDRRGDLPVRFLFRAEDGAWKLDLADLSGRAETALARDLERAREQTGLALPELLVRVVQATSGHLVDRDLWQPLTAPPR